MNQEEKLEKQQKEWAEYFDGVYGEVLRTLSQMPKETKDDKAARRRYIREINFKATGPDGREQILNYDCFCEDLLKGFRASAANKLLGRLANEKIVISVEEEKEKKPFDYIAFMEALNKTVGSFEEGDGVAFRQLFGRTYEYDQNKGYNVRKFEEKYSTSEYSNDKKASLMRMVRKTKQILAGTEGAGKRPLEEVVEEAIGEDPHYSRKDVARVCDLVNCMDIISLDKKRDEGNSTYGDFVADENAEEPEWVQEDVVVSNDGRFDEILETIIKYMSIQSNVLKAGAGKKNYDWIRAFLTRDLLVELKLEPISEDCKASMKKKLGVQKYQAWLQSVKEKDCLTWCHRQSTCPVTDPHEKGCYCRYAAQPAGDPVWYEKLLPFEEGLFKSVFHEAYLEGAFGQEPGSLHRMYNDFLRGDFSFGNNKMAELLYVSKSDVSKAKKKYEGVTQKALYDYCKKELGVFY